MNSDPMYIFNMELPLVSFVMPVYNAEKYLNEAIDSILNQTYKNIDLIIINDGSTDSSKSIIQAYNDNRIRYFENEYNSGIVFTRNKGVDLAEGSYIATLDSDDIALPERIDKQVSFLENNPDYGMCGTFYHIIDSTGTTHLNKTFPTANRDVKTFLLLGNCFCNSTILIRHRWAKELKYQENYDIVEDYELWYRLSKRTKIANLPFYGTSYRVHGTNISVAKVNDMYARVKKINRRILEDLEIPPSAQELEVHSNFLNTNTDYFKSNATFSELDIWVNKFYKNIKHENKYNNLLLYSLLAQKWILICYKTKRYKVLFFNKLFFENILVYFHIFLRRALQSITKTNLHI